MCDLLGINFNHPLRPSSSFKSFGRRGEKNPDGWGLAWYEGKACQVVKEPVNVLNSQLAAWVPDYELFLSKIIIGHIREASKGENTQKNTHPFKRVFRSLEVVFAHNGTLKTLPESRDLNYHPVGETDSEYLFCVLLTRLSSDNIEFADFEKIEILLKELNRCGTMNLIFSEGEHLYVYKDQEGHNGLCLVERTILQGGDFLPREELDLRGFVIASHPLTEDEEWIDLPRGSLSVFKDGKWVFRDRIPKNNWQA